MLHVLQGRTVTIKLKNVNFEVKTRASTVPSTLSTAEEIFAIAKELLKTEVNVASPHPLRLRLMGRPLSSLSFLFFPYMCNTPLSNKKKKKISL